MSARLGVSISVMHCALNVLYSPGQFKANVHQGGSVKPISLNKPLETMVLKTAALCGLDFAGVDVLLDKDSYKICEVSTCEGLQLESPC